DGTHRELPPLTASYYPRCLDSKAASRRRRERWLWPSARRGGSKGIGEGRKSDALSLSDLINETDGREPVFIVGSKSASRRRGHQLSRSCKQEIDRRRCSPSQSRRK